METELSSGPVAAGMDTDSRGDEEQNDGRRAGGYPGRRKRPKQCFWPPKHQEHPQTVTPDEPF
eukprot:3684395-Amphidinium_carterae.1